MAEHESDVRDFMSHWRQDPIGREDELVVAKVKYQSVARVTRWREMKRTSYDEEDAAQGIVEDVDEGIGSPNGFSDGEQQHLRQRWRQEGSPLRHVRPQSASNSQRFGDLRHKERSVGQRRPQSASASRRVSDVTSPQRKLQQWKELAWMPAAIQRSKWTEMLHSSPGFQEQNLKRLEAETYALLKHVLEKKPARAVKRGNAHPQQTRKNRIAETEGAERGTSRPSGGGRSLAVGSGLQVVRRNKSKPEKADARKRGDHPMKANPDTRTHFPTTHISPHKEKTQAKTKPTRGNRDRVAKPGVDETKLTDKELKKRHADAEARLRLMQEMGWLNDLGSQKPLRDHSDTTPDEATSAGKKPEKKEKKRKEEKKIRTRRNPANGCEEAMRHKARSDGLQDATEDNADSCLEELVLEVPRDSFCEEAALSHDVDATWSDEKVMASDAIDKIPRSQEVFRDNEECGSGHIISADGELQVGRALGGHTSWLLESCLAGALDVDGATVDAACEVVSVELTSPQGDVANQMNATSFPPTFLDAPAPVDLPIWTAPSTGDMEQTPPQSAAETRDIQALLNRSDTDRYDGDAFEDDKNSSRASACGQEIAGRLDFERTPSEHAAVHEVVAVEAVGNPANGSDDVEAVAPPVSSIVECSSGDVAFKDTALESSSLQQSIDEDLLRAVSTMAQANGRNEAARVIQRQYRVFLRRRVLLDQVKFLARKQLRKKRKIRRRGSSSEGHPDPEGVVVQLAKKTEADVDNKVEDPDLSEADTPKSVREEVVAVGSAVIAENSHPVEVKSAVEIEILQAETETSSADESILSFVDTANVAEADSRAEEVSNACTGDVNLFQERQDIDGREDSAELLFHGSSQDQAAEVHRDSSGESDTMRGCTVERVEERGCIETISCLLSESPRPTEILIQDEVENITTEHSSAHIEDERNDPPSSTQDSSESLLAEPQDKCVVPVPEPLERASVIDLAIAQDSAKTENADRYQQDERTQLDSVLVSDCSTRELDFILSAVGDGDEGVPGDCEDVSASELNEQLSDAVSGEDSEPISMERGAEAASCEDFDQQAKSDNDTYGELVRIKAAERIQHSWKLCASHRASRLQHQLNVQDDPEDEIRGATEPGPPSEGLKLATNEESTLTPIDIEAPTTQHAPFEGVPFPSPGESEARCSSSEHVEAKESAVEVKQQGSLEVIEKDQLVAKCNPGVAINVEESMEPLHDRTSDAAVRIQCQYRRFVYRRALLDQLSFFVRQHRRESRRKTRRLSAAHTEAAAISVIGLQSDGLIDAHDSCETTPLESVDSIIVSAETGVELEPMEPQAIVEAVDVRSVALNSHHESTLEPNVDMITEDDHEGASTMARKSVEEGDSGVLAIAVAPLLTDHTPPEGGPQPVSELADECGGEVDGTLSDVSEARSLAAQWERYIDTSANKSFYFDVNRRVSQWERPADEVVIDKAAEELNEVLVEERATVKSTSYDEFSSRREETTAEEEAPAETTSPSRERWERYMDSDTNKSFYFNPKRKVSRWDRPDQEPVVDCVATAGQNEPVANTDADAATDLLGWWRQAKAQATLLESNGGWDRYLAREGAVIFYHHTDRDEFRLESDSGVPEEFTLAKNELLSPVLEATGEDKSSRWTLRRNRSLKGDKRGEWQAFVDTESHQTFYYNTLTGESTWEKPLAFQQPTPDAASTSSSYEWVMYVDPATSQPYYVNLVTNATSWEKPPDFDDATSAQELHRLRGIGEHSNAIEAAASTTADKNTAVEQDDYVISITDDRGADEWLAA